MPYEPARSVPGFVFPYKIGVTRPPSIQSHSLPNSQEPGYTAVYRSILNPNSAELVAADPIGKTLTIYQIFERSLFLNPNGQCLGRRPLLGLAKQAQPIQKVSAPVSASGTAAAKNLVPIFGPDFEWISYSTVGKLRDEVGSGLRQILQKEIDVFEKSGASKKPLNTGFLNIGIYSINRPEWVVVDLACASFGFASVALYDTLGPDASEFIVNESEIPVVFASVDRVITILQMVSNSGRKSTCILYIVCMDNLNDEQEVSEFGDSDGCDFKTNCSPCGKSKIAAQSLRSWASSCGIKFLSLAQLRAIGKKHRHSHSPPSPTDIATVCYTSGTTGDPKGALLMHKNFAAQSMFALMGHAFQKDDAYLSYLPLAHIFERSGVIQCLLGGCRVGFYSGIMERVVEDIQILRPTCFISVPRLLNKIYAGIRAATIDAPGVRGMVFRHFYAERIVSIKMGNVYATSPLQKAVFSRVAMVLGGRVRVIISGSAPLSGSVLTFLRAVLMCEVLEGFGQTENAAGATLQLPGEYKTENVGVPIASCEMRLSDVAEMGYKSTDVPRPRGEVCLRGHNIFRGYLKREKETAATLSNDGWLRTGDIGAINPDGTLSIIDRKKNIFKLAQGEYCAPEKIENVYTDCPLVAQIFVHGDSLQNSPVAIVVPNMDKFLLFTRKVLGKASESLPLHALARNKDVIRAFLLELDTVAKAKKLRGFEFVKGIYIDTEPFSVENGLMTPSMKLKRAQAVDYYRPQIDTMYQELNKADKDQKEKRLGVGRLIHAKI